ncbi:hypothetical protein DACRYDRAFT_97975 [Dacryopinax primogenitus]|uniref:BTB domain-containing protein n=1 Tax=Dacryopinax primogenitus (strain DJM 731) TaxID=1858805 RepID=M5GC47_DACPD|nr:uncharacterized protein DACRYDRAFT_97975 [Dacryopinax primogenitus]EJU06599.1 hypothetical protein DACRYDRAFT_97975 [Dacryopinax primogenitus]
MPSLPLVVPSNSTISVSTAFQFEDADLIILSSDSVFFSVHSRTVRAASAVLSQLIDALSASNSYPTLSDDPASSPTVVGSERTPSDMEALFVAPPTPGSHPPTPQPEKLAQSAQVPKSSAQPLILPLPEPSDVLNVILHFLYHLPCTQFLPTLSTLHAVLNALQAYSIPTYPHSFLSYSLCSLLSPHSAAQPLYTYALAASANLEGLAIFASRFCLHVPLSEITEPMAALMGPLYMRRLLFLHLGRVEALKRTLASPPAMHPPSASDCDVSDQKRITRAWALATAYLAWGARPDMSVVELREVLEPLKTKVDCSACQKSLGERIEQLCIDWCAIKDTI